MANGMKIYKCVIQNQEGQRAVIRFLAQSAADIEFAVTSDFKGFEVVNLNLVGIIGDQFKGVMTIDATAFRSECEGKEGGYEGLDLSQYCQKESNFQELEATPF